MNKQRISTKKAAELLGLPIQTLRIFIRNGCFPEFAKAVKNEGSKNWIYYINKIRLYEYLKIKETTQMAV